MAKMGGLLFSDPCLYRQCDHTLRPRWGVLWGPHAAGRHPGGKGLSHHHSGRPPNPVRVVAFLEPFLGIQGGGSQQSH